MPLHWVQGPALRELQSGNRRLLMLSNCAVIVKQQGFFHETQWCHSAPSPPHLTQHSRAVSPPDGGPSAQGLACA